MKYILLTGVSTGIGNAILVELIKRGYFVFGAVRTKKDANKVETQLNSELFFPIIVDVSDKKTIAASQLVVKKKLGTNKLYALINNAGVVTAGPFMHQTIADYRKVFDVNFFGVLKMMQTYIPLMEGKDSKDPSMVLNISSVLGHYGVPYLSTYCASKHALEGFSDSVRRELENVNIRLVLCIPGATKTKIFEKGDSADYKHVTKTDYIETGVKLKEWMGKIGEKGIDSEKVASKVAYILQKKNPRARYSVMGWQNRMIEWIFPRYLPDWALDLVFRIVLRP
ncbi:MAG: SDR family NAD(P)-dependent oxidoreductase [Leptospirales bacterium]